MTFRKSPSHLIKWRYWLAGFITATLLLVSQGFAAGVTWDVSPGVIGGGNGTVTGGPGIWDTTMGNWTVDSGASNIAWVSISNDVAVFGGTAGEVSLSTAVSAGGLTFYTSGYSVTGNTLSLAGTPVLTVAAGFSASVISVIAGDAGFTKSGIGTLILAGDNTFTGPVSLTTTNGGIINLRHSNAFGDASFGTTVNANTALELQGGVTIASEPLSIRGGGFNSTNSGALRNLTGNNVWSGPISLLASTRFSSNSGTLTLAGISAGTAGVVLCGVGNITVNGPITGTTATLLVDNFGNTGVPAGNFTLNGADTMAGTITITNGTLSVEWT